MRTFIALDIPESVREEIAAVSREFSGDGVTLVNKEAMHLSIHFLGDLTDQGIQKVKDSIQEVESKSFDVQVKGLDFFSPSFLKVIFGKVEGGGEECSRIYEQLANSMVAREFELEPGQYTPHITVARVKRVRDPRSIVALVRSHSETDFGTFTVNSIKLKSSELTPEGPVYTDLYELKL
ncbi:MAG: RNA 2',3'-cyclic phosphodiesterase [Candidatus Micrarchaeales archaeon]